MQSGCLDLTSELHLYWYLVCFYFNYRDSSFWCLRTLYWLDDAHLPTFATSWNCSLACSIEGMKPWYNLSDMSVMDLLSGLFVCCTYLNIWKHFHINFICLSFTYSERNCIWRGKAQFDLLVIWVWTSVWLLSLKSLYLTGWHGLILLIHYYRLNIKTGAELLIAYHFTFL